MTLRKVPGLRDAQDTQTAEIAVAKSNRILARCRNRRSTLGRPCDQSASEPRDTNTLGSTRLVSSDEAP